ncbi:MAG: Ribosomal protein, partial [Pseudomonadota bacterium]
MANHKSAIKRHRQSLKRRDRNRDARAAVRTAIKKVRALVAAGDEKGAKTSMLE